MAKVAVGLAACGLLLAMVAGLCFRSLIEDASGYIGRELVDFDTTPSAGHLYHRLLAREPAFRSALASLTTVSDDIKGLVTPQSNNDEENLGLEPPEFWTAILAAYEKALIECRHVLSTPPDRFKVEGVTGEIGTQIEDAAAVAHQWYLCSTYRKGQDPQDHDPRNRIPDFLVSQAKNSHRMATFLEKLGRHQHELFLAMSTLREMQGELRYAKCGYGLDSLEQEDQARLALVDADRELLSGEVIRAQFDYEALASSSNPAGQRRHYIRLAEISGSLGVLLLIIALSISRTRGRTT